MTYFAMIRVLLEMDWQSSLIRNNQSISTQYAPLLAARADIYAHFSRKCGESEKCSLFFQRLASFSAADYFVQIMAVLKILHFQQPGEEPAHFSPFGRSTLFQDRTAILSYNSFVK